MKTLQHVKPAALALLLATAVAGCNTPEQKTEQAEVAGEAQIEQIDSVETSIDNSVEQLEDKSKELERAMQDLDTTVTN